MREAILIVIILGIAIGRFPVLRRNRATIALAGAVLLVCVGSLELDEAFQALDLGTLSLLFAMMVVNGSLKLSGFFDLAGSWILRTAGTPSALLGLVILAGGILSALFLNDTVVLMFTPLLLEVVALTGRNPVPYLLGLALSSNIGSMATIIGNPQNIIIGTESGIPFLRFTGYLIVPSLLGLGVAWLALRLLYPIEFGGKIVFQPVLKPARIYKPLLLKSLVSVGVMLSLILLGIQVSLAALVGAGMLVITRRIKPQRVFKEIDISLLVFFGGLFIITRAVWKTDLFIRAVGDVLPLVTGNLPLFGVVSAVLSNLISNVPAVMLLGPLIPQFASPEGAWIFLAMSSTLAGNLTLLGSVANLIVAESAGRRGCPISFLTYLKAGLPVTLVTIAISTLYLLLVV
jgi:Na+/H+ antiporter NhaD/arsenite permease-like protein